ncbi:uncharacterized protein Aud_002061 [Aspergillus udagawae]|uniref:Uncharacterized protein n=1 Tax=Aspergillus udagawae TaxID=91492 RepID=A0A8E0R1Z1_9EURO|nr:uncharacterized protein Aud_002061 [Aspergillus udagawae]GIC94732.1 hypothetical protein Aud_002061 [Aspergillus udagawae]
MRTQRKGVTENTPSKKNKKNNTMGNTPTSTDKDNSATAAATTKLNQLKKAQSLAQDIAYSPFTLISTVYTDAIKVDFTTISVNNVPPVVPKFKMPDTQMPVVRWITDQPHSFSTQRNCFIRLAYMPAFLKYKMSKPFYKFCDSAGQTLQATDCYVMADWRDEIFRLKAAKEHFLSLKTLFTNAVQTYAMKMVQYRCDRRNWELNILRDAANDTKEDKATIKAAKQWVEQENHADDNGDYKIFDVGDFQAPDDRDVYPQQWMQRDTTLPAWVAQQEKKYDATIDKINEIIAEKVKPPTTGQKRTLNFVESDDEEDTHQWDLPDDLTLYGDWVAFRHASWAKDKPKRTDNILSLYNIPSNIPSDPTQWPQQLLSLSRDKVLKNDEDFSKYPWGRPAYALQATLAKAPGYTKDSLFTIDASNALRRLEGWFFNLSKPAANGLDLTTVEQWPVTTKIRDPIVNILKNLNADETTHPAFFKK